jgi:leader peptidase (prepilin peptidase)/N-methyltransferase
MTIIFLAILGAAVGSFLNVCIDRLPRRQSMLRPASHCDGCRVSLRWMELLPIISFLVLRGRCRYCQVSIPRRSPIVETIMAASFALLVYYFGLGTQSAIFAFYIAIFTVIFFVDLEQGIIPNRVIYPAAGVAVLLSLFLPEVGLLRALIGGILAFGLILGIYLAARGGMGGGDVKLAGLIGLAAGFPAVIPSLLLACLGGGVIASILLASRRKRLRDTVPFGPFLAVGALARLLWGSQMVEVWMNLS